MTRRRRYPFAPAPPTWLAILAVAVTVAIAQPSRAQNCGVMEFGGSGELVTKNIVVNLTSLTASELETNGACDVVDQYAASDFEDGCPGEEDCIQAFADERRLDYVVTGAVYYDSEEFSMGLRLFRVERGRFTGSIQQEIPRDPAAMGARVAQCAATLFGIAPPTSGGDDDAVVDESLADRLDLPPPEAFEAPPEDRAYDDEPTEDDELDLVLESLSVESLDLGFDPDEDDRSDRRRRDDDGEDDEDEYDERDRYRDDEEDERDTIRTSRRDRDERRRHDDDGVDDGFVEDEDLLEPDEFFEEEDDEDEYDERDRYSEDDEVDERDRYDEEDDEELDEDDAAADEEELEVLVSDAADETVEAVVSEEVVDEDRTERRDAIVDDPVARSRTSSGDRAALRFSFGVAHYQNVAGDFALGLGIALAPSVWLDAEVGGWLGSSPADSDGEVTHLYMLVPASVGVVFKGKGPKVRPFGGVGALLFSYFIDPDSGKMHVAPGGRGMGGAEFLLSDRFALQVNGTVGFVYSQGVAELTNEPTYTDAALVASIRAGFLIRL